MLMANQSTYKILNYYDLGMIDYKKAWDIQKEIFELRNENLIPDTLMLLEHPHTYTLGKVADKENLISTQKQLNDLGIKVYNIDRGRDITYHGPGQIVGYPIINLNNWRKDTHAYLRALEEIIILTCNEFGLAAKRNPKYTGVWIDDRKIAAIGIKVSRWITMHGFAFNINTDLGYYGGIIPCGIKDKEVTSLKKEINSMNLGAIRQRRTDPLKADCSAATCPPLHFGRRGDGEPARPARLASQSKRANGLYPTFSSADSPCIASAKQGAEREGGLKKGIDLAEVKNCLIKNFKIIFEYSELHLLHKNNLFSILSKSENQIPLNTE